MKENLKQKSNGLLHVFCRTGGITCSSVVDIIWYFLQLDFYLFMLIYTTRFRKLPLLETYLLSGLLSFLDQRPSKKIWFFKNNPYLLRSFVNLLKYTNFQNSSIAISWIFKARKCIFQWSRTFKLKNFPLGANQGCTLWRH